MYKMSKRIIVSKNKPLFQTWINTNHLKEVQEFIDKERQKRHITGLNFSKLSLFSIYIIKEIFEKMKLKEKNKIHDIYSFQNKIRKELNLNEKLPIMTRSANKISKPISCKDEVLQKEIAGFIELLHEREIKNASLSIMAIFSCNCIIDIYNKLPESTKEKTNHIYDIQYFIREQLNLDTTNYRYI